MRLPSVPCSSGARTDTGTSARSSSPAVGTPRRRSQRPSAPLTAASTTSLTVAPKPFFTARKSSRGASTQAIRRCGPMRTLSGVGGAGLSVAQATSPRPSTASRALRAASVGRLRARSAPPASSSGVRSAADAVSASRSSVSTRSVASGFAGRWGRAGSGSPSKSTVAMSTPETPSMTEWCVFETSAKRPPSSPSTSHASQSGRERSSRCE